jgi:hypothetical protein
MSPQKPTLNSQFDLIQFTQSYFPNMYTVSIIIQHTSRQLWQYCTVNMEIGSQITEVCN